MAPAQSSAAASRLARQAGEGAPRGRRAIQYRGLFQRELPMMMYGFGDSRNPDPQAVEVMEALTISFLADLCHRCRPAASAFPASRGYPYITRSKVKIDDLKFALRKDGKKLARLEELLYLEGIISGAKKILSADAIDDVARQVEAEEKQAQQDRIAAGHGTAPEEGEEDEALQNASQPRPDDEDMVDAEDGDDADQAAAPAKGKRTGKKPGRKRKQQD